MQSKQKIINQLKFNIMATISEIRISRLCSRIDIRLVSLLNVVESAKNDYLNDNISYKQALKIYQNNIHNLFWYSTVISNINSKNNICFCDRFKNITDFIKFFEY